MRKIEGLLAKYRLINGERFFHEVFTNEAYRPVLKHKADIVVDVGALAGEFSAYIYPKAKKIYAIEPHPEYFKELVDNVLEFNLRKIQPFRLALAGENTTGFISDVGRGGDRLTNYGLPVEIKTLATFMKENKIKRIDVLKIDIENGEDAVFNAPDFAPIAPRIRYIVGEHLAGVRDYLQLLGFYKLDEINTNDSYMRVD